MRLLITCFLLVTICNVSAEQNISCDFRPAKIICDRGKSNLNCGGNPFICANILEGEISVKSKLKALVVKVKQSDGTVKPVRLNNPPNYLHNYLGNDPSDGNGDHTYNRNKDTVKKALQSNPWIQNHIPKGSKVIDIAHNGFIFPEYTSLYYSKSGNNLFFGYAFKRYYTTGGNLGELLKSIKYGKEKYNTDCSYLVHPIYVGKREYIDETLYKVKCYVQKSCVFKDDTLIRATNTCYKDYSSVKTCPKDCLDNVSQKFDEHFKKIKQCEEPTIELITQNSGLSDDKSSFDKKCAVLYSCTLKGNKHEVTDMCPALPTGICPSIKDCVQQAQAISEKRRKQTPQKQPENAHANYQNWLKSLDIKKRSSGKRINEKAVMNPEPPPQPHLSPRSFEDSHTETSGSVK